MAQCEMHILSTTFLYDMYRSICKQFLFQAWQSFQRAFKERAAVGPSVYMPVLALP